MFEELTAHFPLDVVLNILGIVILFILVRLLAYKPAKKFLDARKEKIEKDKNDAKASLEEAEAMKKEYADKVSDAENDAKEKAAAIIGDANRRADEIVAEANERAEKVLALAEAKIKADREASIKNSEKETVALAISIAEKILERRVTDGDTINMADKFFKDFTER